MLELLLNILSSFLTITRAHETKIGIEKEKIKYCTL